MESLASFFESFQPKDWITAGLSVAAVVASGVALAQKRWYHPKPNLVPDSQYSEGNLDWYVTVTNHGNADAHDLRFTMIEGSGERTACGRTAVLSPGKTYPVRAPLAPEVPGEYDAHGNPLRAGPIIDTAGLVMDVAWRQNPGRGVKHKKLRP